MIQFTDSAVAAALVSGILMFLGGALKTLFDYWTVKGKTQTEATKSAGDTAVALKRVIDEAVASEVRGMSELSASGRQMMTEDINRLNQRLTAAEKKIDDLTIALEISESEKEELRIYIDAMRSYIQHDVHEYMDQLIGMVRRTAPKEPIPPIPPAPVRRSRGNKRE